MRQNLLGIFFLIGNKLRVKNGYALAKISEGIGIWDVVELIESPRHVEVHVGINALLFEFGNKIIQSVERGGVQGSGTARKAHQAVVVARPRGVVDVVKPHQVNAHFLGAGGNAGRSGYGRKRRRHRDVHAPKAVGLARHKKIFAHCRHGGCDGLARKLR